MSLSDIPGNPLTMTDAEHWALSGHFRHLIYSPRGDVEGLMLDVDGVPVQFVVDPPGHPCLLRLQPDQSVQAIGRVRPPSHRGESVHEVYDLVDLVAPAPQVDADAVAEAVQPPVFGGRVLRFNYARHGEPNGVVLDNGDFLHTRPEGLRRLGWQPGQTVRATGTVRALVDGRGRVVEVDADAGV